MVLALALMALAAFLLAFASHSAGWMGVGLFVGFVCGIGAALVFIDRHIRASSRPEHMTDREAAALRASMHRDTPPRLPPSRDS